MPLIGITFGIMEQFKVKGELAIEKGSRHSKIIGAFGEAFLCNWLSRSGYEVAIVDHTGLDLVAYHPRTQRRLGITVKSRTRGAGKEADSINVFSNRKKPTDREKLLMACKAFACEAWVGIYVETAGSADLYLISLDHFEKLHCTTDDAAISTWKMTEKHLQVYETDTTIQHIRVKFEVKNWTLGISNEPPEIP